jgi:hypothetical protein
VIQYRRKIRISGNTLLLFTKTQTKASRDAARIEEYRLTIPLLPHRPLFPPPLPFRQPRHLRCQGLPPMDLSKAIQAIAAVAHHHTHQLNNFQIYHTVILPHLITNNIQFVHRNMDTTTMKNKVVITTAFSPKGDTCRKCELLLVNLH